MKIVKCVMRRDASVLTITPPLNRKEIVFVRRAGTDSAPLAPACSSSPKKNIFFFQ
jgi:hypothetical protein